jgi:hypothetical protein
MPTKLLERLFQGDSTSAGRFRPGLSDAGLADLCERVGIDSLPPGLEALYRWKDPPACSTDSSEYEDTWFLLSSAELATAHWTLRERFAHAEPPLFDPCWIPFLRNGSGDYLCAVAGLGRVCASDDACTSGGKLAPGVVLELSRGTRARPARFASVTRWLELTTEGLERHLLRAEDAGGLRPVDPIGWEAFLDENNTGFVNGDPAHSESTEAPSGPALLRSVAVGVGTASLVALAIMARVFRRQFPLVGFVAILGLTVAGLLLLAAQVHPMSKRNVK